MENMAYREEQVTIDAKYPLKGTIAIPEGTEEKYPAVLIIVGSGQVDRNGRARAKNINLELNSYTQLSDMITKLGFVTLRFDKRGVGESGGNYFETGMWDLVDDIQSNIEFLKKHPKVDSEKIILLGHSEGSMLATVVNAQKPVSGLILLSGAAERLAEATARQRELAIAELMNSKGVKGILFRLLKADKKAVKQNEKLMKKIMESKTDTLTISFNKLNVKWFREHFSHDVIEDLKKATCPVLAITGSKDFQANPEKIKAVPELVKGESEYHIVENMDHSLKEYSGPIAVMNAIKQYKNSEGQPIHPELRRIVTEWLLKRYKI